jgi:hypothetical protein
MKTLKIDTDSFNETAEVLAVINPRLSREGYRKYMDEVTSQYWLNGTFFGTSGFYITCFCDEFDVVTAKATVMAYSVKRYLAEQAKNAEE